MSRAAVLIALSFAAVLSIVAAVVLRTPTEAADPRLVAFDPAAITAVTIKDSASTRAFKRDPKVLVWHLRLTNADGSVFAWSADEAAFNAALASLAAATHLGPVEPLTTAATTITLDLPEGPIVLRVGSSTLAGRAAIEVVRSNTTRTFAAPVSTLAAFTGPIEPLLNLAAIHWPFEPIRLTLTRRDQTIALARFGREWRLTDPIAAPADRKAVAELQAALSNLRLTAVAPVPPGLAPEAALTVHISTGDDKAPYVQSIAFTSATGSQATILGPDGSVWLTLRDPDLQPIFVPLTTLLSKQAVARPVADVMAALILRPGDELTEPRAVRRDADRWVLADQPLPATDTTSLLALLDTLCVTPAAATLLETPADFEPIATLRLHALGGVPIGGVSIGLSTPQAAAAGGINRRVLTLVTGPIASPVTRLYPVLPDDPMLAFLRANLP